MWLFATIGSEDGRKTARTLLQYAIGQIWNMTLLPDIAFTKGGKPWFPDHPECHFNLSHSGSYVLCGLADTPIGVDIEEVVLSKAVLAPYIMHLSELTRYRDSSDKIGLMYTLWTLKESYVKCTGEGITYHPQTAMKTTVFDIGVGQTVTSNRKGFSFKTFSGKKWRAAICVKDEKKYRISTGYYLRI